MSVNTQWRTSFGGVTGLDYTAIRCAFEFANQTVSAEEFAGIQIMERAALETLAQERGRG